MLDKPETYPPYAYFALRGKELDPREVTEFLGVTPSRSFMRGENRTENKKWPHGYWALTSSGQIQSTDFQLHLEWLVNQLEPVKSKIIELQKKENIVGSISCFWILPTQHELLTLSSELLDRIASLKMDILFDIYCHDSEHA